jgi:hypothetical protein
MLRYLVGRAGFDGRREGEEIMHVFGRGNAFGNEVATQIDRFQ